MADLKFNHSTCIYVLEAYPDSDLLAIGGEHSVQILKVSDKVCQPIALFHLGSRVTALAWSSKTSSDEESFIELTAATIDFGLHLLTKSASEPETTFHFGGGLSGHHGKVTGMAFCGGRTEDSTRYVATVSDDKMLMIWDLHPAADIPSSRASIDMDRSPSPGARKQPTAYVIAFPNPLISVCSHPTTSKEFLVADCRGSIFVTDWRSDPEGMGNEHRAWRHSSPVQLLEPHALADTSYGLAVPYSGSIAWRRDNSDIVGATYGSRFSIWDISKLHGGKPSATGSSFPEGGHRFRWSQTYPEYFAISTQSPLKGAVIHVHNTNYVNAQPTVFNLAPHPHLVRDFDFLGSRGIPQLAVAISRSVHIFSIGTE